MAGDGRRNASRGGILPERSSRDWWMLLIFVGLATILVGRLVWIQIIKGNEYAGYAENQRTRSIELPAERGTIYDRNGNVLATTVNATTIYANPTEITNPQGTAQQLADVLGGETSDYLPALTKPGTEFSYVVRKADPDLAEKVEALEIPGLYFLEDFKRVYPYEGVGGQVIGVTDADGNGVSGLELQYDETLIGEPGLLVYERGQGNIPMSDGTVTRVEPTDGEDIVISIDIQLQQQAEQVLRQALADLNSNNGWVIIYDGATGEIYAAASAPMLNQEDWRNSEAEAYTLKAITLPYEPGSTFKAITASILFQNGVVGAETEFDIPPELPVDDFVITDNIYHDYLHYTFREVIANSSNIGTVLAAQMCDQQVYFDYLVAYGFGEKTGVDFPGESSGVLLPYEEWTSATHYNVPFGQGISTTPLQMVRAYGAFTNGGVLQTPHFLIGIANADTELPEWPTTEVITPEAAGATTDVLISVVDEGGGWHGAMEHYTVAAKTGTAQFTEGGHYRYDMYNVSYCGYLPYSGSQLICLITVEAPDKTQLGPYFAEIMNYAADLYQFKPDR